MQIFFFIKIITATEATEIFPDSLNPNFSKCAPNPGLGRGRIIFVITSPFLRIVFLLKMKKSFRETVFVLPALAIFTFAFSAIKMGAESQQDAPVQRFPPMVAELRTCSEPI